MSPRSVCSGSQMHAFLRSRSPLQHLRLQVRRMLSQGLRQGRLSKIYFLSLSLPMSFLLHPRAARSHPIKTVPGSLCKKSTGHISLRSAPQAHFSACQSLRVHIFRRIHIGPVHPDSEVEMGPCGVSRRTDLRDGLSLFHTLPL